MEAKNSYEDYMYSPYNLNPRENDLQKISARNEAEKGLINQRIPVGEGGEDSPRKDRGYDTYS